MVLRERYKMKKIIITIDETKLKKNTYFTVKDIINTLEDRIQDGIDHGKWLEYIWNEFDVDDSEDDVIREIINSINDSVYYELVEVE